MKTFIFDIDGTLANIEHRRDFVRTKPKNWSAFNNAMHLDTPNEDIIWLAQTFHAMGHTILIASGRGEEQREVTEKWLKDHNVPHVKLFMRPAKDNRRDDIIKEEILFQIEKEFGWPDMVFDDREQVVNMWRKHKIRCLQVDFGDF